MLKNLRNQQCPDTKTDEDENGSIKLFHDETQMKG